MPFWDVPGNVSIEAANAEPEESGVFTKGGNAACCRSYKYTKKAIPVKTITMLSLGLMMAALLIAMIALFVFEQPMELAMMISCTAFVLMMVMVIVSRQGGVSLQLIQYLRDEVGDYYMVQFTKGMSTKAVGVKQQYLEQDMQKAQDTGAACFYVNRYKAGYKDYDPVIGGEAKVICLKELKLIRKGLLKSKYSYRQNGRKRKIKIKNCYDGLVEELSRYQ